jgi:hypothetical protein
MLNPPDNANVLPRAVLLPGKPFLFNGADVALSLSTGLCVFVGPNGSGKSETLRSLRDHLRSNLRSSLNKKVVYLAAGRSSALEQYRSITGLNGPQNFNTEPAAVGYQGWQSDWWQFEGNTGMLLRLKSRPDLLLKVEARLQALYQKRLKLTWAQSGLQFGFSSSIGGSQYYANVEASGILELVPLLAAIYDDQIGVLLIDEPEISLHPQLQAFLMQELRAHAGDPAHELKKLIVLATHSPTMLPVRRIDDVSNLVFFIDGQKAPVQIAPDSGQLKSSKLSALVARLSENHKIAFFSRRVLLVEGPSDEIVVNGVALKLEHPILGANTQVVPVTGKGQFSETVKFFRLMSKDVFVLADLDALADDNRLVNVYRDAAQHLANKQGMGSVTDIDRSIRDKFQTLLDKAFDALSSTAVKHRYWTERAPDDELKAKRRSTLAALLSTPESNLTDLLSGELTALRKRYDALLDLLAAAGCVVLRRGTIEDYYSTQKSSGGLGKPESAAIEVETFSARDLRSVKSNYDDVVKAIEVAAPIKKIDENALLREQLGSLLGAAFQIVKFDMSDDELNARIKSNSAYEALVFEFKNRSSVSPDRLHRRIEVNILSPLFKHDDFPFEVSEHENLTIVVDRMLPSH